VWRDDDFSTDRVFCVIAAVPFAATRLDGRAAGTPIIKYLRCGGL
jgi:hypothetical protein